MFILLFRHYTMVFNTFVFLQCFNEINARKVAPGEMNVFKGIFGNWMFLTILAGIAVVQVIITLFGGQVMKTDALNWDYRLWLSSLFIAFLSIPLGSLV